MNISEKLEETVKKYNKPYINQLAWNLQQSLPHAKVTLGGGYIYLDLYGEQESNLKQWLFSSLDTLPEIEHPIERVRFVVRVDSAIELVTLINPSESDVRALEYAVESELKFSQATTPYGDEPLPLDHPYYSDKNYFKYKPFKWVDGKKVYQ